MSREPSHFQPYAKSPMMHPGWLSRSLFWAAIVVAALPSLIILPLMASRGANFAIVFSIAALVGAFVQLILGIAALLLTKNTTWPRRLTAGGLYLLGCLVPLIGTPLVPMILNPSAVGVRTVNIVQSVIAGLGLVLALVAWNIVRNRRWWILLVAVICAVITAGISSVVSAIASSAFSAPGLAGLLIQAVSLALIFASLGLCHLLSRLPNGTVPLPVQQPRGQWAPPQHPGIPPQTPPGYGRPPGR